MNYMQLDKCTYGNCLLYIHLRKVATMTLKPGLALTQGHWK